MKVNEDNYETIKRAEEITGGNNIRWFDAENIDGYIETDNLLAIINDLVAEYHRIEEEYQELEQDLRDNYKPISKAEQSCVSDRDFI